MIGVALVAFITVFGASATSSIEDEVNRGFVGDLVIQGSNGFSSMGVSRQYGADLKETDGVDIVSAQQFGAGQVPSPDGTTSDQCIGALNPNTFADLFQAPLTPGYHERTRD